MDLMPNELLIVAKFLSLKGYNAEQVRAEMYPVYAASTPSVNLLQQWQLKYSRGGLKSNFASNHKIPSNGVHSEVHAPQQGLLRLPEEIVISIMQLLPFRNVLRLEMTCSYLRQCGEKFWRLQRAVSLADLGRVSTSATDRSAYQQLEFVLKSISRNHGTLLSLELGRGRDRDSCESLPCLRIGDPNPLSRQLNEVILSSALNLTTLVLESQNVYSRWLKELSSHTFMMTSVSLNNLFLDHNTSPLTDCLLVELLPFWPMLTSLSLANNAQISFDGIDAVIPTQLERLDICGCPKISTSKFRSVLLVCRHNITFIACAISTWFHQRPFGFNLSGDQLSLLNLTGLKVDFPVTNPTSGLQIRDAQIHDLFACYAASLTNLTVHSACVSDSLLQIIAIFPNLTSFTEYGRCDRAVGAGWQKSMCWLCDYCKSQPFSKKSHELTASLVTCPALTSLSVTCKPLANAILESVGDFGALTDLTLNTHLGGESVPGLLKLRSDSLRKLTLGLFAQGWTQDKWFSHLRESGRCPVLAKFCVIRTR